MFFCPFTQKQRELMAKVGKKGCGDVWQILIFIKKQYAVKYEY